MNNSLTNELRNGYDSSTSRDNDANSVHLFLMQKEENNLMYLKILNNSSISESPGNNGRWLTISANIHPTDHTSTGVE